MKKIILLICLPIGLFSQTNITLASWNFATSPNAMTGGAGNWGPSSVSPNSNNAKVTVGALTRGSGIGTPAGTTAAASAWGGTGNILAINSLLAVANNSFFTFTVQPQSNMLVSLKSIPAYNIRRSSTGASTGIWQYNINGGLYTDIGTSFSFGSTTTAVGNNQAAIDLSAISPLQNITSSTTVGFRLLVWGASNSTGTMYFNSNTSVSPTANQSFTIVGDAMCYNQSLVSSSITGLTEQCVDDWTYYGTSSTDMFFAIRKNGSIFNATVDLNVNSGSTPYTSTSSNGANQEHASYLIGRYWNASLTSGSISTPVDIRFYFGTSDTANARTSRDNAFNTLKNTTNTNTYAVKNNGLEWFKTTGTSFVPSNFTGNKLTVAHTKLLGTYGVQNGVSYIQFTGITSFSGGTGGFSYGPASGSGGNGLPVTWAGIVVNKNQRENELVWKTASEQNTSHFEVESSEDGANFKTISGKILAAGNSQDLLTYSFVDNNYFPITYYRVKQIDLEGSFDYSKIVVSKRETIENNEEIFDAEVFSISNNLIGIELKNAKFQLATTTQLIDISGKVLETVSSDASIQTLDISKLQSGIYFVQVQNADKVCTKKIAKF